MQEHFADLLTDMNNIAGGITTSSMTSRNPPNRVTLQRSIVVQLALRPAGTIVYDSDDWPRL